MHTYAYNFVASLACLQIFNLKRQRQTEDLTQRALLSAASVFLQFRKTKNKIKKNEVKLKMKRVGKVKVGCAWQQQLAVCK